MPGKAHRPEMGDVAGQGPAGPHEPERIAELSAVRDRLVQALTGNATPQQLGTIARHPAYTRPVRN
ncbi:hypothetical protein ABN273_35080 [Nonomuraea sp. B19D2]